MGCFYLLSHRHAPTVKLSESEASELVHICKRQAAPHIRPSVMLSHAKHPHPPDWQRLVVSCLYNHCKPSSKRKKVPSYLPNHLTPQALSN
jgi:hypothetical protein